MLTDSTKCHCRWILVLSLVGIWLLLPTAWGDVNGDGYGDFLVGATRFSGKYAEGGKVYLYLGSKGGLSSQPAWTAEYPLPFDPSVDGGGAIFFWLGSGGGGGCQSGWLRGCGDRRLERQPG